MVNFKLFLIALVAALWLPVHSQSIFWEEDFDTPPEGWNLGENWAFQEEALMFRWYPPNSNYDISAISPVISLPDEANMLTLLQYLGVNTVLATNEMAEISIIHNNGETMLWEHVCADGNWGNEGGAELNLPITDYAGQDIQIKLRSYGALTDIWNFWFIYEMNIKAIYNNDLELTAISGSNNIAIGENGIWDIAVKNVGSNAQSNFNVNLICNKTGNIVNTGNYSSSIPSGETATIQIQWASDSSFNTTFTAVLDFPADEYHGNNKTNSHFLRIEPEIDYDVLVIDMDNGLETIYNPETNELEEANQGLENALNNAGINYVYDDRVPSNLADYEMVILTLGSFCLG